MKAAVFYGKNNLKIEEIESPKARDNEVAIKVIECVGRTSTMEQAISVAGKKSTVMFFGLTAPDAAISLKPFELFKKELELKSSYTNPYTQERAIEMIDSKRIDVSTPIYKTASLDKLPEILADEDLRRHGKFIIIPNC